MNMRVKERETEHETKHNVAKYRMEFFKENQREIKQYGK